MKKEKKKKTQKVSTVTFTGPPLNCTNEKKNYSGDPLTATEKQKRTRQIMLEEWWPRDRH